MNFSSSLLNTKSGVPQGSVLGTIFFLICLNDSTFSSDLNVTFYANDSALSLAYKNVKLQFCKLILN